ncbi:hypothetical protein ACTU3I_11115 [Microbacterium sp. RD1]|uniref:hypothetical protein n=1 Tax=Microbacterium sp. RD1 TaxID=3457313 RepID=UPI003FA5D804
MTDSTPAPDQPDDGDVPPTQDAPTGGDEMTEANLQADNEAEEDMLRALDPEAPTG